jgi:hypothetical protein
VADPCITIKAQKLGGFAVAVNDAPAAEASFDKQYGTYREARGYGRGLRLARGWKLHDMAEADHVKAI